METINYNGNIYQLGMTYLFRDSANKWPKLGMLSNVIQGDKYPFKTEDETWKMCEELPPSNEIGTITPEPIELIDGKAYQFQVSGGVWLGFYQESRKSFFTQFERGNKICSTTEASNIQPLTVEIE